MSIILPEFVTTAVINGSTLVSQADEQFNIMMNEIKAYVESTYDSVTAQVVNETQVIKDDTYSYYSDFLRRYLGAFSSNPTVDALGNPLVVGALYFNTVNNELKVYNGSTFQPALADVLVKAQNLADVPNKTTARTNLDVYSKLEVDNKDALKLNASSYTASDVLTKIKTVDGASSGLDADLLDGQHGSYYQQALVSGTNIKTLNGSSILGSGNFELTVGSGGYAANVYLTNLTSITNAGYKQLSYAPDVASTVITGVANNNEVLAYSSIFDGDVLATSIPAGEWGFHFHRKVNNNAQVTKIRFEVFARSSSGVETVLFSTSSLDINDTDYVREDILVTQPVFTVAQTDRVGLKVYVNTTRTSATTVSFTIGDGNALYMNTPLQIRHNQLRARDDVDAHPISSITGLQTALNSKLAATANAVSATKLATVRTISLTGDVTGSATFDGTANASITATIAANSVALGTDTTGDYVAGVTAGTGISISGNAGEGWSPTITNTAPNVTTNITTTHNATNVVVNSSDGTNGTINGATQTLAGVMTATDKTKLDGIATGATANTGTVTSIATSGAITGGTITTSGTISHSTADGYLHVPATGTTNNGKVLTAGATAGSLSWTTLPSASVTSVAGKTGAVTLVKDDVGLGSVDNTADSAKNVLSATKWTTARTIALAGDVTGSASVDGSANVTITTTVQPNSIALGTDTTGNYVAGATAGTGITVSGTAGEGWSPTIAITNVGTSGTYTKVTTNAQGQVTSGTTLSSTDIPSLDTEKLTTGTLPVARGGTGTTTSTGSGSAVLSTSPVLTTPNIGVATGTSFNGITGLASVTPLVAGTAAVGTSTLTARQDHVHPAQTTISGNAGTATTLQTARTVGASGDVTGTATSFNGSANITIPMTLANSGVTAGTYKSVTVDAKGRVTAGSNPTTLSGYGITDAYTKTQTDSALALKTDKADTDSVNMLRADKFLAAQNIANMIYTSGDLTKIRYNTDTDSNYEVLNYVSGNLSSINHYTGGVLRGTTTLSYTNGNLVSAVFA